MFLKKHKQHTFISLIIIVVSLFSFIIAPAQTMPKVNAEGAQIFLDVPIDNWASEYINRLAAPSFNIIKGIGDGIFGAVLNATRAEVTTFIDSVMKVNIDIPYQGTFSDVNDKQWYSQYVEAEFKAGIIKGKGNNLFEP